jgi:hypothetical protein
MEITSSFEGMPIGLPLLQSHPKTLSELICSPFHKDFYGNPFKLCKNIFSFQPPLNSVKTCRASQECQEGCQLYRTHSLSKINSSPTTTRLSPLNLKKLTFL